MSVDRQYGQIVFVCDGCGEGFETKVSDFTEAVRSLKDEGWKFKRCNNDDYEHRCPTCQ